MAGLGDITGWLQQHVDPRSIVSDARSVGNFFDPARPYNQQAAGLQRGSEDAKALAALQWQREMQGLSEALGYTHQAQGAINAVYAPHAPALPVGMAPPAAPQAGAPPPPPPGGPPPAPPAAGPPPYTPKPGLARYMNAGGRGA